MSVTGRSVFSHYRPRQWAVETNVLLGFIVTLCVLLLMSVGLFFSAKNFLESSRWVDHTHQVLDSIAKIRIFILESESANRAYLITDDQAYLQRRNDAFTQIRAQIPVLKSLVADNPLQRSRIPELSILIEGRLAFYDHVVQTKKNEGFVKMQGLVKEALWREEITRVIALLNRMEQEERYLLVERNTDEEKRTHWILVFFVVLVLSVALLKILLFRRIRHDLLLRKSAEADQKRLLDILDAAPDYIATGHKGQFEYLNRGGRKMLDIGEDEDVSNLDPAVVFAPGSFDIIVDQALPAAMQHGQWTGETTLLSRSGREIPISQVILAHWNEDGSFAHFSTIGRDISHQKRFAEELTLTSSYDQTHGEVLRLFNSSFDRNHILKNVLGILAARHPLPVSAFYLYDEWAGKLDLEASHSAPAAVKQSLMMGEGIAGHAAQENHTVVLSSTKEMSDFAISTGLIDFPPESVIASPIQFQGSRLGVLVVASSIKATDRDLQFIERISNHLGVTLHNIQQYGDLKLLAEQLRLRSEEIDNKNVQLEEANRMKSEFLATMSHELRTPLNAIIGFSEIMRDGLTGNLNDKQQEYISDIYQSGEHLLSLINDVLDLSKIEAGKMTLDVEMADIPDLLKNTLSIVKERAANHGVKLRFEPDENLAKVSLDPRKLKQIVYNLLSNAVKFTPEGGEVCLSAGIVTYQAASSTADKWPEIRTNPLQRVDEFLEISVIDTGIGINAEDLKQLFQPFVQIDSSLSRRFEGTGLGLSMVRKLSELHGGTVSVSSEPGHGSKFTVWLPYSKDAAPSEALPVSKAALHSGKFRESPRVLVIEDDDQAADLIRIQLEADGCEVIRAASAETALVMLGEGATPDLITLDILLPGMDGWEFLIKLKDKFPLIHIPVVIISVVAENNRSKGLSLGASEILQKPVSANEFSNALANVGLIDPHISGRRASVLIIDDDPKAVEIIASYLAPVGYTVLRSYGGLEGIQNSKNYLPDLIVLDLMMPEINGFDVVEALKKDRKTAQIPIIVLTAKVLSAKDRIALNGSVLQVMKKSEFNHGNFISEVRRALKSRKQKLSE